MSPVSSQKFELFLSFSASDERAKERGQWRGDGKKGEAWREERRERREERGEREREERRGEREVSVGGVNNPRHSVSKECTDSLLAGREVTGHRTALHLRSSRSQLSRTPSLTTAAGKMLLVWCPPASMSRCR